MRQFSNHTRLWYSVYLMLITLATNVQALDIQLEFAPGTLFSPGTDATAIAAINAAAADVSAAITSSLAELPTDIYLGTNQATTATFDWSYTYSDPSTGNPVTIETPSLAADTVTLFVGTRGLSGNALGVGGPAGIGVSLGVSGFPNQSPPAIANGAANSQAALTREAGSVIGTVSGGINFAGVVSNYSVDYGVAYGSFAFDNDLDNNGLTDSATDLEAFWHFDHTTPVAPGRNDLYSVAIHEIIHTLGIGTSDSWEALTAGSTWNGAEVQTIIGSGANLLAPDGSHIANSVISTSIVDGSPQEVALDPDLTVGTRKALTELDLAFLRDIGFETIEPVFTSPPDFDGDNDIDGEDLAILESSFGLNAGGDTDADGDTDGADFLAWQRQFTGPSASATTAVPEPTSAALLLGFLSLGILGRRGTR